MSAAVPSRAFIELQARVPRSRPAPDPETLIWAETLRFTAYGVTVAVRLSDRALLPAATAILPPGAELGGEEPAELTFSLHVDDSGTATVYLARQRLARAQDMRTALVRLENALDLRLAIHSPDHLFIHASAVLWRDRALILPGRSQAGKSTLVHALCRRGAAFLSDEFAVLDRTGHILPYPRPIGLRGDGVFRREVMPAALAGPGPYPVDLVALTRYEPGASWRPRSLPRRAAVLALLDNAPAARTRPHFSGTILAVLAGSAQALDVPRGEAAEAAAHLLDWMEGKQT